MSNSESAAAMARAARALVDALDGDDRRLVRFRLSDDDDIRRDWSYVPRSRPGLPIGDLGQAGAMLAFGLVSSGLSDGGFAAATAIMALEDVLDRAEGGRRHRHRGDYSVSLFGDPDDDEWGWRFEGHHISLNFTLVDGAVSSTPLFLGANPAEVRGPTGAAPVTRPLAAEEDLALALFDGLTPSQRDAALVSTEAPDDILTATSAQIDPHAIDDTLGLRLGSLSGTSTTVASALVRVYVERLPVDLAAARGLAIEDQLGDVRFAFAGEAAHLRPHYYRLVGRSALIEYDNTQNGANHVHTVLRDGAGDFGVDLLREHRARHPHGQQHH